MHPLIFLSRICLLLCACWAVVGATACAADTHEVVVVVPTASGTSVAAIPVATGTQEARPTATATGESQTAPSTVAPTATAGATATATRPAATVPAQLATPTLVPFTPLPLPASATPSPAGTPLIHAFELVADEAVGTGRRLTFRWEASGASAMLVSGTAQRMGPWWPVPPSGELTVDLRGTYYRDPIFTLYVSAAGASTPAPVAEATATVQITWACATPYFFEPAPRRCPLEPAIATAAAEQLFEGGAMLWLAHLETIVVLYPDGRWERYPDSWDESQPALDPALVAPAGRYQPERGFGKVWREQSGVRARLGWALGPEQGFAGLIQYEQHEGSSSGAPTYVRRLDGSAISLFPFWTTAGSWQQQAP